MAAVARAAAVAAARGVRAARAAAKATRKQYTPPQRGGSPRILHLKHCDEEMSVKAIGQEDVDKIDTQCTCPVDQLVLALAAAVGTEQGGQGQLGLACFLLAG